MTFESNLKRAKEGDGQALQSVLEDHLPQLNGFVRLRSPVSLRRRESCADVVQSVCRQVIGNIGSLRGDSLPEFREWLYAIALSKILEKQQHHRAAKRDARRDVEVAFDSSIDDASLLRYYGHDRTPSREVAAQEEIARIEGCFDRLPDEQREVLLLSRFEGLSHGEIAARLQKTEPAVRKVLSRARARLAMLLAEPGSDDSSSQQ